MSLNQSAFAHDFCAVGQVAHQGIELLSIAKN
jgi:hypothetical protein